MKGKSLWMGLALVAGLATACSRPTPEPAFWTAPCPHLPPETPAPTQTGSPGDAPGHPDGHPGGDRGFHPAVLIGRPARVAGDLPLY